MNTIVCQECDVEFKVKCDADPEYFPVLFCPFCGERIDQEEIFIFDPESDED